MIHRYDSIPEHLLARAGVMRRIKGLRYATLAEYATWIKGYLAKGGKPDVSYDYNTPKGEFLIATLDFALPYLTGAKALSIIIPPHVTVTYDPQGAGHSNLYFIGGFSRDFDDGLEVRTSSVSIYRDTELF